MAVYFLQAEGSGLVKIGTAGNATARVQAIQSMCSEPLHLLAVHEESGLREERELHRKLEKHRSHGEWFSPAEAVLEAARHPPPVVAPVPLWRGHRVAARLDESRPAAGSEELVLWAWESRLPPVEKLVLMEIANAPSGLVIAEWTPRKVAAKGAGLRRILRRLQDERWIVPVPDLPDGYWWARGDYEEDGT